MPTALLIFLLQAGAVLPPVEPVEQATLQQQKLELEFDQHWEMYLLAEHGCPDVTQVVAREVKPADCTKQPSILADEFAKARRLAMKVFLLREKK